MLTIFAIILNIIVPCKPMPKRVEINILILILLFFPNTTVHNRQGKEPLRPLWSSRRLKACLLDSLKR